MAGTYQGLKEIDGYPTLLANVKAIHNYINKLKEEVYITKSNPIITVGHSLGGYLCYHHRHAVLMPSTHLEYYGKRQ